MGIKHLLIGLLTAAAAIACKQEAPVIVPEMNLSQTVATVSADGGNVSFEVTSNVDWTASYSEDWVSVSPSAGKSSSSPVKVSVSVDPNESAASRNATVTISADKISKTFKVSQEGRVEEKPVPVEITWGVVGALVGNDWKSDVAMSKNGSWLVAEGVEFEEVKFKIRGNGTWEDATNVGLAPGSDNAELNSKITVDALGGKAVFAAADKAYEIDMNAGGSDDDGPEGTVVNGKYWFIEPQNQKVMTALDESVTYGHPAAVDAVDGASTPENAYTLTYDPDWSCFTIQDSYGRYLYSAVMADGGLCKTISVSETLPAGEREKAYYMWVVYAVGDGTYDIYNNETYYSITYSPENDNWEIYDPYEPDFANMYPTLVKAE